MALLLAGRAEGQKYQAHIDVRVIFGREEETVTVFSLSSADLLSPYLVEGGSHETTHFHMTIVPVLHKAVSGGLTISVTNKNARQELHIDTTVK